MHLVVVLPHGEPSTSTQSRQHCRELVAPQVTISFCVTWRPGVLTRLQMPMSVFLKTLINVRSRRAESALPILFFPLLTLCCYCVAHFGEQINFLHKELLSQVVHSISNESIISRGRGRERERKVHRQRARVKGSFRGPSTENCRSWWV